MAEVLLINETSTGDYNNSLNGRRSSSSEQSRHIEDSNNQSRFHFKTLTISSSLFDFCGILLLLMGLGMLVYGFTTISVTVLDNDCNYPPASKYSHVISQDNFAYSNNYSTLETYTPLKLLPDNLPNDLQLQSQVHECVSRGSTIIDVFVTCVNNNMFKICNMFRWIGCNLTTINVAFLDDTAGAVFIGNTINDATYNNGLACIPKFCFNILAQENEYDLLKSNMIQDQQCTKNINISRWTLDPTSFLSGSLTGLLAVIMMTIPKILSVMNKNCKNDICSNIFFHKIVVLDKCDDTLCPKKHVKPIDFPNELEIFRLKLTQETFHHH